MSRKGTTQSSCTAANYQPCCLQSRCCSVASTDASGQNSVSQYSFGRECLLRETIVFCDAWKRANLGKALRISVVDSAVGTGFIKKHTAVLLTDAEVHQFVEAIQTGKMPKGIVTSFETRAAHLASLKDRHDSTITCPKCASALVLRTVKSGAKAGSRFYGCSTFPKCRFTRPVE